MSNRDFVGLLRVGAYSPSRNHISEKVQYTETHR